MSIEEIMSLLHEALTFTRLDTSEKINIISLDSKLSQLGIDSISALEMAAYIEDKLNIHFPDNELGLLVDIQGFVNLIQKYAKSNASLDVQS